jgi:PiT family inorganic phosphate transporter
VPLEHLLIGVAFVAGLYMAWNIGANDVANAFGMSVGSGALTLKRAILLAAVFEFCGAFFVGAPVAKTISSKIILPDALLMLDSHIVWGVGMLSALIGASLWLNVATFLGQPVSTTHAVIGGVMGFAAVAFGAGSIHWAKVGTIALSWVISPLVGGVLAYVIYQFGIRKLVLRSRHPVYMAITSLPFWVGGLTAIILFSVLYHGLPGLRLDLPLRLALPVSGCAGMAVIIGLLLAFDKRRRTRYRVPRAERYARVERWFARMQISTACYMSFAHGANDVANAIGPLAVVMRAFMFRETPTGEVPIPSWLLALGGVGIVLGLATYGYKVIEAVGRKITEITPTRGFSADFATATTVLFFSKLGMPISTTFVIVGAVMGVGFARGFGAIDLRVIRRILASWLVTIPISAFLTILLYRILMAFAG